MRLTLKEKQAVTRKLRKKYKQGSKKQKGEIIDWLVEVAGYGDCVKKLDHPLR